MKIVIIGGGGHGRVIIDIVEKAGLLNIVGLLDAQLPLETKVLGHSVIGRQEDLARLVAERAIEGAIVAIGDNGVRSQVVAATLADSPGIAFPNAIHPSAQIAKEVQLGQGNVVMAGVCVNSNTSIGDFCVLNTRCSVDHDCRLGNFVNLAPNSCAGGNVEIGDHVSVCLGANVIHGRTIGAHTIIGAGATVLTDLPASIVAYGTPAREIRERRPEDGLRGGSLQRPVAKVELRGCRPGNSGEAA